MNSNFKNTLNNETVTEQPYRARLAYKCAICDKEFDNIQDRAKCELACLKKQEEEKRLAAEKKKKEEQAARKKEVDEALAHAYKLRDKYVEDYGRHVYTYESPEEMMSFVDLFRRLP